MPWQIESSTTKGLERWGGLGSSRKDREEARAGRLPKRQAEGAPVPGLEAAAAGNGTPGGGGVGWYSGTGEAHVGPGSAWLHVWCPGACCPG